MTKEISLTAIILTYNEEIHLERCLNSLKNVCKEVVIIDSFSTDKTKEIAVKYNVRFYQNKWVNYATQFNWGIKNGEITTDWVMRIDADEYLSNQLIESIQLQLPTYSKNIQAIRVKRLMYFLGKPLKKAGMYPIWHVKLWRNGFAKCEQRWMDERMKLEKGSNVGVFEGDLIDENLNNLTWWTEKHNGYATREAIDILDSIYNFTNSSVNILPGKKEKSRRWLKERYLKLPLFIRPFMFFLIRYFLQGGFLEGKRGFIWNVLQCGWYRFLVDVKIYEAYKKVGKNKENLISYFKERYGYDITKIN